MSDLRDPAKVDDRHSARLGPETLPAVVPQTILDARPARSPKRTRALLSLLLLLAAAGGIAWWFPYRATLPPGFAVGNGRLDADEIDIDTKYPGRIAEIRADEGDLVKAGQVLAVMDTRDVQAQLKSSQAQVEQARRTLEQAQANFAQQQTVLKLAQQEIARTRYLVPKGFASIQDLDRQQQALNSAQAALNREEAAVHAAEHGLEAASHQAEYYAIEIADSQLMAPKDGPIEYRVANVGEVLAAGGKVFTMLDASYVYMDIYLPTAEAGRVALGTDARIVLDAYPELVLSAHVVYVASQAQFTPKAVETKDERAKLMFRVRVRIDPAVLAGHAAMVRSGLPGVSYVRTETNGVWPADLMPKQAPGVEK